MAIDNEHAGIILQRVFENGVCSDRITLISGKDDQRISIHRAVLTAASKYFAASLGSKTESNFDHTTDGRTVKTIVDFCYTGRIDLTEQNVKQFLTIASSVELDLLEGKCRRFYNDNLTIENAVETLMISDKYCYADLRQRAFDIICVRFEMLSSKEIQKLDHRFLKELLKCDKIQATEDSVFTRLLEWYQNKEDERRQHMPELLKLIRLEHISSQFLKDTVSAIFISFHSSHLVIAEYGRRASNQYSNIDTRRFRSIFRLVLQNKRASCAKYSAVQIEKFNNALNSFDEAAEITFGDRKYFRAVLQKNKLFVLGGSIPGDGDREKVYLKCVSSYNLTSFEESILPEMNNPREDCTPVLFGKYIYVFGGYAVGKAINSCERFDTEKNEWKEIKSMKNARWRASAAILNGYIYVAGTKSVELYDPNCDEWTEMKPMNRPRNSFALIEANGFLYAMGGGVEIIEKYSPNKNCWTEIGSFDECERITSGINVAGQIFVLMRDGKFGEIKIDESDKCSFVSLAKSNYESYFNGRHSLHQN